MLKSLLGFSKNKSDAQLKKSLKTLLGFSPGNISLYKQAFLHSSTRENVNNERMEFLGDAILGAVVAEHLFKLFPYKDEGFLTQLRSKIVNGQNLQHLAVKIGIDKHLKVGIKENENGEDAKSSAVRVTAWASTWGIRQFQQFGGVPVSLWRELRRVSGNIPEGVLRDAFEAADSGNWAQFLKVLGGATPKRSALPVKLAKEDSEETGKYGDPVGKKIIGVEADSIILQTRIHHWIIFNIPQNRLQENGLPQTGGEARSVRTERRAAAYAGRIRGEAALEFCQ